jgi:GNAT superfamily N-acetyltransferase
MSGRGTVRGLSGRGAGRLPAPARRPAPDYRPARPDDLPAASRVWAASLADYLGPLGQPTFMPDLEPIQRLFGHLLRTDPERFWVATRRPDERPAPGDVGAEGERIVGFASATVRGDVWFLGMLFIDPGEQARGVGRSLLELVRDGAEHLAQGTATDSAQPISNALYARMGIVARLPVLHLTGRPERAGALPPLADGRVATSFDGIERSEIARAIATIDLRLLGHEREADHRWLLDDGRMGVLFRDEAGEPAGYGYTTRVGRIAPVAALDPADLAPFVGHLLGVVPPTGSQSLWVPGAAGDVVRRLLEAGFRLEPFPALLCWTRPFAPFDRYLPISLALI